MRENLESFRSHPFRMKALEGYFSRQSTPRTKPILDEHVATVLEAQGFSWENDPRSIYDPEQLYSALARYAPGTTSDPDSSAELTAGLSLAHKCFAKPKDFPYLTVLPLTARTVVQVTSNPGGSAGLTAFGRTKAQSQTQALERSIKVLKGTAAPEACIAFARTQAGNKTRLVWGFPYSQTVIEGLIAKPLNEALQGNNTPMAFAITNMALGAKLRVAAFHKRYGYSIDSSAFDSSISRFLIRQAFRIIKTWFNLDEVEPTTGVAVRDILKQIEVYFSTCPLVMPDGRIYYGRRHGVPSGSFFTQIVDSIVNTIVAGTISARFHMSVGRSEIFVLGDDLLIWSDRLVSLDKLATYASEVFGIEFNSSKSQVFERNDVIHYLGRDWHNGMPDLDVQKAINKAVYPERYRRYSKLTARREKEVYQLFLNYATNYLSFYQVAKAIVGNSHGGEVPLAIDCHAFGGSESTLVPSRQEHLSGLAYYKLKYGSRETTGFPHTAIRFLC